MSYGHIDQYSKTKHTPHSTKILVHQVKKPEN